MSKDLPYFRWFPKDAEADFKYISMSLSELGLFHRCLNLAWLNDGIPSDVTELARLLRLSVDEVETNWKRVSLCFVGRGKAKTNPRQEEERNHALTKSAKSAAAARTRYGRTADADADAPPRAFESESKEPQDIDKPSLRQKTAEADEWFENVFWPLWPVKDNKSAAKVRVRHLALEDRQLALEGVRAQSAKIKAMERPIHASTWLHNRRWEDETRSPPQPQPTLFHPREDIAEGVLRRAKERIAYGERPI